MKSKHKFVPSQVVPMEERALLSTFPAWIFPVTTLGLSGNRVLTATTYNNAVVSPVAHAIQSFENGVITAYDNNHSANGAPTAKFYATVGIGEVGLGPTPLSYPAGTLLGQLDATMGAIEFRLPYGGGTNPGTTGGSGLSNKTAFTTGNLVSQDLLAGFVAKYIAGTYPNVLITPVEQAAVGKGLSVAEYMGVTLSIAAGSNVGLATPTSAAALTVDMNGVRFAVVHYILPSYVQDFGPEGLVERFFGLKNK